MTLKKEEAVETLTILENEENKQKISKYIEKINNMSETEWNNFLKSSSIKTKQELEQKIRKLLEKKVEMIALNDLIKYGYNKSTLHIHVVPEDIHNMLSRKGLEVGKQKLIDALEKIEILLKEDSKLKDIDKIYAVSPILRKPIINIFEELDFDTRVIDMERAKTDEEFKDFYEMFNKSKQTVKKLGRASISKEKLLSNKWNTLKEKQKIGIGMEDTGGGRE